MKLFNRHDASAAPAAAPTAQAVGIDDLARAIQAAAVRGQRGRWGMRLDEANFDAALGGVVSAVNETLAAMEARQVWYEAILDAIPFLLSVTDMDMNWTFINKPMEELAGKSRQELVGHNCTNLGAPICKTEKCGVETLRRGDPHSLFDMGGMDLQDTTRYIVDRQGNKLGHMEVIQDVTSLVRSSKYQEAEAQRFAEYLQRLAGGDLSFVPEVTPGDQHSAAARENFVRIADGLTQTLETMRGLIGSLQSTAAEVADASAQIESATEQSAQVTQEVATTIQQVAVDAQASRRAAERVTDIAATGRTTVEQTIEAMRRITSTVDEAGASIGNMRELSKRIGAIVQAIDEIADQTNMLALNAAIEAARAGEHGRGFAVVAEEVRKLADRSRQATREIGALISDVQGGIEAAGQAMEGSAAQVASGAQLAGEAGGALANIADAAAESNQQALQIAEGATGVAATTEEMSAQIEELTASAQMLAHLSAQLREHANQFRVEAAQDGANAPVPLRPRALAA